MKVLNVEGEDVTLRMGDVYETTGRPAIRLVCLTGEPFGMATVNLENAYLMEGEVILDTNNIPSILDVFVSEGIAEETGTHVASGFCEYPIVKLLEQDAYEVH